MSYWQRKGAVLVILGLTILLYIPMRATPGLLYQFYKDLRPRWSVVLTEWSSERGGETVLPAKVRAILSLLREHKVSDFRYSDAIARDSDESVPQRLAEGAYPITLRADARHQVLGANESPGAGCTVVGSNQEVMLVRCP